MKSRAFKQVDVFSEIPYLGNPLAVVLDGTGLSDQPTNEVVKNV